MTQWWERSPPTNVSRVRFPDPRLSRRFSSPQNQHFLIDQESMARVIVQALPVFGVKFTFTFYIYKEALRHKSQQMHYKHCDWLRERIFLFFHWRERTVSSVPYIFSMGKRNQRRIQWRKLLLMISYLMVFTDVCFRFVVHQQSFWHKRKKHSSFSLVLLFIKKISKANKPLTLLYYCSSSFICLYAILRLRLAARWIKRG